MTDSVSPTTPPQPSQKSLDLVGTHVIYEGDRRPGQVPCTVTAARKVSSTITRAIDGSTWSSVQFRLKPDDGSRAFWTPSMPDEELS